MAARRGEGGSRDALSRERVLRGAMDLADGSGLESLTMRELGRRLGVEAASLYNHVSGKDELLDGMADLVVAEIEVPSADVGWKEAMRRRAVSARGVFSRHPWAAALIDTRGTSGPGGLSYADRVLGTLLEAGFSPAVAGNSFLMLDSYIYGFERQRSNLSLGNGVDPTDAAQELLAAIPPDAFPSLARVAAAYAARRYDENAGFDFGLDVILDGLDRVRDRER